MGDTKEHQEDGPAVDTRAARKPPRSLPQRITDAIAALGGEESTPSKIKNGLGILGWWLMIPVTALALIIAVTTSTLPCPSTMSSLPGCAHDAKPSSAATTPAATAAPPGYEIYGWVSTKPKEPPQLSPATDYAVLGIYPGRTIASIDAMFPPDAVRLLHRGTGSSIASNGDSDNTPYDSTSQGQPLRWPLETLGTEYTNRWTWHGITVTMSEYPDRGPYETRHLKVHRDPTSPYYFALPYRLTMGTATFRDAVQAYGPAQGPCRNCDAGSRPDLAIFDKQRDGGNYINITLRFAQAGYKSLTCSSLITDWIYDQPRHRHLQAAPLGIDPRCPPPATTG